MLTIMWPFLLREAFLLMLVAASLSSSIANPSFSFPSGMGVKWRYWVQDGRADSSILSQDFKAMADVGAASVEFMSYQSYGFPVVDDIGEFGYGSANMKKVIDQASDLSVQYNLTLDICAGPSQGAGIPVKNPDVNGYNTELAFGFTIVKQGASFQDLLPSPNIFPMLKYGGAIAPAYNVTTYRLQNVLLASLAPSSNVSSPTILLDFASVMNVMSNVTGTTLSLSPVSSDSVVVAFYERRNGYQEAYGSFLGPNDNLPASWGAFVVDHFSKEGANTIDNFTQSYLFSPVRPSLQQAGRLIFEDSLEFRAQLFWTPSFMDRFNQLRGYSSVSAMPAFYSRVRAPFQGTNLPPQVFAYSDDSLNARFAFDYCDTLTTLYMDYVKTRNMNARNTGLKLSLQAGYGFPVDIAAAAGVVDVPEIESLGFTTVETCRLASGGAHLGGANVLSSELGAEQMKVYAQTMSEIIKLSNTQFAGSVNRLVIHGFPYNGPVAATTWPGFTTFSYVYSEMHGPRQPGWSSYSGYFAYLARTQYVLQKGSVGKVDIAVYHHDFNFASSLPFASNVLQLAGYTYEYISPYNLDLPLATVSNNRLGAFDVGPGYKALILNNQKTIVASAAATILALAKSGLPIIVVGDLPTDIPGYEPTTTNKNAVVSAMNDLVKIPNVRMVNQYTDIPLALTALSVRPAAAFVGGSSTDKVFSIRRSESTYDNTRVDYYWLYNSDTNAMNLTINFETQAANASPFYLDTWTGSIRAISVSSRVSADVVQLAGIYLYPEQTIIFAFTNGTSLEGISTANAIPVTSYSAPAASASATNTFCISLGQWKLAVNAYTPPSDLSTFNSLLVSKGPLDLGDTLTAWNSIPELAGNYTSGIGVYSTTFSFKSDPATTGAILDLSRVTGGTEHTITVSLNGQRIASAVDTGAKRVELPSSVLQKGVNTISIEIASTLLNAINTVSPTKILTVGGNRLSGLPFTPPNTKNGMEGIVQIVAFDKPGGGLNPTPKPNKALAERKVGTAVVLVGVMTAMIMIREMF